MIDLSGSRGLGFLSTTNGSNSQLRETILTTILGLNQTVTTQTGVNQQYANQINSIASAIEHYFSGWNAVVTDTIAVSSAYSKWWADKGKNMQMLLNQYQDTLIQLDRILKQKGR